MYIDEALKIYLLAQPGLTALIGRRLYPMRPPQTVDLRTNTAVSMQTISDYKNHILTGQIAEESPKKQWTVFAPTQLEAFDIAKQIKLALIDFEGSMSGIIIQYIKLINEIPSIETSPDGTVSVHTVDLEFGITYTK